RYRQSRVFGIVSTEVLKTLREVDLVPRDDLVPVLVIPVVVRIGALVRIGEENRADPQLVGKPSVARLQQDFLRIPQGISQADARLVVLPLENLALGGAGQGGENLRR